MIFRAHHYVFLLHYLIQTTPAAAVGPPAYTPTDIILLNCGDWTTSNDSSSRRWAGDEGSTYAPSHADKISSPLRASSTDPSSVPPVPYRTARVFRAPFTYTFPVSPGHKFLRLYFNRIIHLDFDTAQSLFSITANDFTLLTDFSGDSSRASFIKEFVVGVGGNQLTSLHLTFSPVSNSFGFVNGIEIVSMPDNLYFEGRAIKYIDGIFELRNDTALENVYRVNVGGIRVAIGDDSGMFREWSSDDDYLVGQDAGRSSHLENVKINYTSPTPRYSAPPQVYTSTRVPSNYSTSLNWEFVVDSGFMYLLRFHLCEFRPQVAQLRRQRLFSIFIDGYPAETQADVVSWAGGTQIPIFRDYVTWVPAKYVETYTQKQQLRLSLFVENGAIHEGALLNGLEIFKLNNSHGVLAAAIPALIESRRSSTAMYAAAVGSVVGVCALVVKISIFMIHKRQQKVNCCSDGESSSRMPLSSPTTSSTSTSSGKSVSQRPSKLCTRLSLQGIRAATSNFHTGSIIGKGGFGYVYRGIIDNGATTVAVKRLNPSSNQGALEFLTEIDMLSKLRHAHLVSLIGYCDDEAEMILVYDYMARGSLRNHLYNTDNPPLTWKQRLQICMGAAKGLHYLHSGTQHSVIHRDVKSTNILLDENWVAKISDFGLSKMVEAADDSFTHVSTNVKGTFGYLDPKYISTHQLTRKSDVYAFGVVMFEVLSGRPAVDVSLDEEQHSLAGWARLCVREGEVERLVDPNLVGQISAACLQVFVGIGRRSIHIQPLERPTMADVVMGLELALVLQEHTKVEEDGDDEAVVVSMDGSKGVDRIMSLRYPRFS